MYLKAHTMDLSYFLISNKDLQRTSNNSKVPIFSDGTSLFHQFNNIFQLNEAIKEDFNHAAKCLNGNKLSFNVM